MPCATVFNYSRESEFLPNPLEALPPNVPHSLTRSLDLTRDSGLSRSQTHIWIGQARHPESSLYNMAFAFMLEGEIDHILFGRAWQLVVDRSEALRTSIDQRDGMAVRRVRGAGACALAFQDFSERPDPDREFHAWAVERCGRFLPLDGELIDSVLVKLAPHRYGWYVNAHHLVTDASSTVLLFRHVTSEYAAMSADNRSDRRPLAPLTPYYTTVQSLDSFPNASAREDAAEYLGAPTAGGSGGRLLRESDSGNLDTKRTVHDHARCGCVGTVA